jgi:hypothetical protein
MERLQQLGKSEMKMADPGVTKCPNKVAVLGISTNDCSYGRHFSLYRRKKGSCVVLKHETFGISGADGRPGK